MYKKFQYTCESKGKVYTQTAYCTNTNILLFQINNWNRQGASMGYHYYLSSSDILYNLTAKISSIPIFSGGWYGELDHHHESNLG